MPAQSCVLLRKTINKDVRADSPIEGFTAKGGPKEAQSNLVPRVSHLPAPWSERREGREDERPWEQGWAQRSYTVRGGLSLLKSLA